MNDLSIEGQFPDFESFSNAIDQLMIMRSISRRYGREIYCHRNLLNAQITKDLNMQQLVQRFDNNKKLALLQWLTRQGPYWEDSREHASDDYLEYGDEIVTDTAIGEAASRCYKGNDSCVVSMIPSRWNSSPLQICWHHSDGDKQQVNVKNYFVAELFEEDLRSLSETVESWRQLEAVCRERFMEISFSIDAFDPLLGHPFLHSVAKQIIERLEVLKRLRLSFDILGNRTSEGHRLYQDYFTGKNAWFSGSSDNEKNDFKSELTFKHPGLVGESIFCPMHGKVKTTQTRIHFSWPIQCDSILYVVYIGPKITKT
ncbi:MAG: hypothetical protein OEY36_08215 [Gammaproteobacteria bacterium]|nr:hypothetical protein [Gammaproteobacteria bacterium]